MKAMRVGLFFLWISLGMAWAGQREVVEPIGNGEINWSQGIILAKGSGAPPKEAKNIAQARLLAERAALADARRNLMEVLRGVRVDSITHVENHLAKSDQIRLSAEGFIQGSSELRGQRKYLSDGAIEVTVAVSLSGEFLHWMLSLPKELKAIEPPVPEKLAPPAPLPALEKKEVPSLIPAKVKSEEKPVLKAQPLPSPVDLPPFTGLVIDARGLNLRAALIPKILNDSGEELYQGQYVPLDSAARNGLALYTKDLTAAQTNPRVGKNPLTVKGSKVSAQRPADIMLSPEDSKRIAPFAQKGTFLEECKVMIVLD